MSAHVSEYEPVDPVEPAEPAAYPIVPYPNSSVRA
jgi:hypothetical protein